MLWRNGLIAPPSPGSRRSRGVSRGKVPPVSCVCAEFSSNPVWTGSGSPTSRPEHGNIDSSRPRVEWPVDNNGLQRMLTENVVADATLSLRVNTLLAANHHAGDL